MAAGHFIISTLSLLLASLWLLPVGFLYHEMIVDVFPVVKKLSHRRQIAITFTIMMIMGGIFKLVSGIHI